MPELARAQRQPAPRELADVAAIAAALTAIVMLALDEPLARWIGDFEPSAMWDRGIDGLEYATLVPLSRWITSFVVVGGMLATVVVPRLRPYAPAWIWLAATHILARLAMNYTKIWTGRLRPSEWLARPHLGDGPTFGWTHVGYSFPSGHVVQFASLAIPIGVLYPRARWPLAIVVGFVAVARIVVDAHFVSDTLGALALTALVAWLTGLAIRPMR